jgi:glycosyltransferase involved in cell wall biosynthesis
MLAESTLDDLGLKDAASDQRAERPAPVVTIGVPLYNAEKFLPEALDSLLSQRFRDFEIVISDNASDDGTEEICRRYAATDRRVRYIRHGVNRGAVWNHNFLIEEARGRFFRWHHADDICEPGYLERCVAALESDPAVVLVYSKTLLIDANGRVTEPYEDRLALGENKPNDRLRHLLCNVFLCNPVLGLMRIDTLRRTACLGSYIGSDHVLLAEFALAGRWAEVPEVLFRRRIHAGQSTAAHASRRDRAAWLDPRLRNSRFLLPNLRLLVERLKAVGRASITGQDRLHCLWTVIAWEVRSEAGRLPGRLARIRNRLAGSLGSRVGHLPLRDPAPQTINASRANRAAGMAPRRVSAMARLTKLWGER